MMSSVFDSVTRQIKALRQTPLEKAVSDATSNDNWGTANSVLIQLARETSDFNNFSVIIKGIWDGINDKREKWRRIYKSLVLLEYCLKHGSERVCNEARADLHRIRPLQDFKFMEEGRDKGSGIREKAKFISDILADAEMLRTERAKALESKEKYAGISSAGGANTVVASGYAKSLGGVGGTSENTTDKLEEYRQKEKLMREEKQLRAPVMSNSGKLVIKTPATTSKKEQASSCSSSVSNLIDFDAPVVVPQYPSLSLAQTNAPQQQFAGLFNHQTVVPAPSPPLQYPIAGYPMIYSTGSSPNANNNPFQPVATKVVQPADSNNPFAAFNGL